MRDPVLLLTTTDKANVSFAQYWVALARFTSLFGWYSATPQRSPALPQHPVERRDNLMSCRCTDIFEIDRINVWLRSGRRREIELLENVRAEKKQDLEANGLEALSPRIQKTLIFDLPMRIAVRDYKSEDSPAVCQTIKPWQCYQNWTSCNCKERNSISQFLLRGGDDALQVVLPYYILSSHSKEMSGVWSEGRSNPTHMPTWCFIFTFRFYIERWV